MSNDSAGVEVGQQQQRQLQNYTEHINSSSFLMAPVEKVFFLSLLMM